MLTLNGANQYALFDALAAGSPEGIPTYAPLSSAVGHPLWVSLDVKPTGDDGTVFMFTDKDSSIRYMWGYTQGTQIEVRTPSGGTPVKATAGNGVWQRWLFYFESRVRRLAAVNGVSGAANTTANDWPVAMNEFIVGARHISSGVPDNLLSVSIANLAIGCAPLTPTQIAGNLVGVNPQSLPGIIRYWPLLADANGLFGAWNLTLGGAPAFSSVGHPAVEAWPPAGGGGVAQNLGGGFSE